MDITFGEGDMRFGFLTAHLQELRPDDQGEVIFQIIIHDVDFGGVSTDDFGKFVWIEVEAMGIFARSPHVQEIGHNAVIGKAGQLGNGA